VPAVLVVTLAYLAILVGVLAVGLILIAWRLWAVAKEIRRIRDALAQVEGHARPLGEVLGQINGALTAVGGGLDSVLGWLVMADSALGRIAEKLRSSAA
jgi:hypothetical protein